MENKFILITFITIIVINIRFIMLTFITITIDGIFRIVVVNGTFTTITTITSLVNANTNKFMIIAIAEAVELKLIIITSVFAVAVKANAEIMNELNTIEFDADGMTLLAAKVVQIKLQNKDIELMLRDCEPEFKCTQWRSGRVNEMLGSLQNDKIVYICNGFSSRRSNYCTNDTKT